MSWGIGTNRDSGVIAGYRRLLDVRIAKNIYRGRSCVYDTVGHAPLAIDRLLDVRTTKVLVIALPFPVLGTDGSGTFDRVCGRCRHCGH